MLDLEIVNYLQGDNAITNAGARHIAGNLTLAKGDAIWVKDGVVLGYELQSSRPLIRKTISGNFIVCYNDGSFDIRDENFEVVDNGTFMYWPKELLDNAENGYYLYFSYNSAGDIILMVALTKYDNNYKQLSTYHCIDLKTGDELFTVDGLYVGNYMYSFFIDVINLDNIQWGATWDRQVDANGNDCIINRVYKNGTIFKENISTYDNIVTSIPLTEELSVAKNKIESIRTINNNVHQRYSRDEAGYPSYYAVAQSVMINAPVHDAEGNIVYEKDENGNIIKNEYGYPVETTYAMPAPTASLTKSSSAYASVDITADDSSDDGYFNNIFAANPKTGQILGGLSKSKTKLINIETNILCAEITTGNLHKLENEDWAYDGSIAYPVPMIGLLGAMSRYQNEPWEPPHNEWQQIWSPKSSQSLGTAVFDNKYYANLPGPDSNVQPGVRRTPLSPAPKVTIVDTLPDATSSNIKLIGKRTVYSSGTYVTLYENINSEWISSGASGYYAKYSTIPADFSIFSGPMTPYPNVKMATTPTTDGNGNEVAYKMRTSTTETAIVDATCIIDLNSNSAQVLATENQIRATNKFYPTGYDVEYSFEVESINDGVGDPYNRGLSYTVEKITFGGVYYDDIGAQSNVSKVIDKKIDPTKKLPLPYATENHNTSIVIDEENNYGCVALDGVKLGFSYPASASICFAVGDLQDNVPLLLMSGDIFMVKNGQVLSGHQTSKQATAGMTINLALPQTAISKSQIPTAAETETE